MLLNRDTSRPPTTWSYKQRSNQGNHPKEGHRDKQQHEALRPSQRRRVARNLGPAICGLALALIPSDRASKKSLETRDDGNRSVWRLVEYQSPRTARKLITSASQQETVGGQSLLRGVLRLVCFILTRPDPDSLFATAFTISPNHYPPVRPTAEAL